jgi:Na+:H+ antiporter, NhaA family
VTRTSTKAKLDRMNNAQRDGLLLAASAVVGMALMNSPWASAFEQTLRTPLQFGLGSAVLQKPIALWINDFLMAIFFLAVGIEIKHEWQHGALSTPQARVLPFGAAVGGMAVPALIYVAFNWGHPANLSGWAVPSATDIAFALGLMALAAPKTRPMLLAFLTAVAVLDDLGAIIVIALFYTDQLSKTMLAFAAVAVLALFVLSSLRVRRIWPYVAIGLLLWLCVLNSGVHATLAGVAMGLLIPSPQDDDPNSAGPNPSRAIEHAIKPWISWVILPLFGVVNAGVALGGFGWAALAQPVTLGIAFGLLLGKPVGILLGIWAASKVGGGLPQGLKLLDYLPVACFCGIGFTMALFIATLAFDAGSAAASAAKLGVLMGTLMALTLGTVVARWRS